ncbi:MAG: Z1 domain-containing protein [Chloroflexota bacterium]
MAQQMPEPELIQVIPDAGEDNGRWNPTVGPETESLLANLRLPDQDERNRVRAEAFDILRRAVPPRAQEGSETGLAIGYVQSGKTMSFTTVAALARDNRYPMIIIIGGVSTSLFGQSEQRLIRDLRLEERNDRNWLRLSNPKLQDRGSIEGILEDWADDSVPDEQRQTVLITVMKNHRHLSNLNRLLTQLQLTAVPVLVIDDEADQAGLNSAVRRGAESTTYRRILAIRRSLAHHTYLQYTATPQAPLLINLIDMLSPGFARLLTPGATYTGGQEFFRDNSPYVRVIPAIEIPTPNNPLTGPPESLLFALKLFWLGVTVGVRRNEAANRSMMVHPSQQTAPHAQYFLWVQQAQQNWLRLLQLPDTSPDREELITEFAQAHAELQTTVADLPPLEELLAVLPRAIRRTVITEINATRGRTPAIDWLGSYAHILVGGQAMDRGFTVEGLSVTYMPRDVGVGNADTIQQRARFLGYKAGYLGYCRVFINRDTLVAYRAYVDHEEDIRRRLARHAETGRPLSEWKRAFFLDANLSPTRAEVLDLDYMRGNYADDWVQTRAPHDSDDAVAAKRAVVDDFLSRLELQPDEGSPDRTDAQRHLVTDGVPLAGALERLLLPFRLIRLSDSERFTGVMLQIKRHLDDNPNATCCIYRMRPDYNETRRANAEDEVPNLMQGANPPTYEGDRALRAPGGVTIQIHILGIESRVDGALRRVEQVPALAVWMPGNVAGTWITQPQGRTL